MSKSRQNKKVWKKAMITYDVAAVPKEQGVDFEMLMNLIRNYGILVYDSSMGDAPRITPKRYSVNFKHKSKV